MVLKLNEIRKALLEANYDEQNVSDYIAYIDRLMAEKTTDDKPKNWWLHNGLVKEGKLIAIYKTVAKDGLFIDGDIITISYKKKLLADYSYQAYRKKLLMTYPDTIIDSQVVYEGDEFSFTKDSGKVIYTHKFKNPFEQKDDKIIGAYCIVKNRVGEFIELLSMDEAMKMKEVAKTKNVWDKWLSRMMLKSAIKRVCKTFFYDSFKNVELLDNENYDLDTSKKAKELLMKISKAMEVYQDTDKDEIIELLNTKIDSGEANITFLHEIAIKVGLKEEEL